MATKDLDSGNVIKQVYNPATEALQVDIVASSGAGGLATAAKQDQQTALLTDIENNTDGLETSLTSLDNKTPALVAGRVPVDGSGVTQPISAVSLPLPTGAATEGTLANLDSKVIAVDTTDVTITNSVLPTGAATSAAQTTGNASLSSIDSKIIAVDTGNVTVASSALPTGAATSANQTTANSSLSSIDTKLNPLSVLGSFVIDFSSIPDSVTAPYEITAGFGSAVKKIALYETTGETLQLRTGAASGSLLAYVGPGQDSPLEASISASTRITVRSNGSAPTAGSFIVTFLG